MPTLGDHLISNPVATNALTHGLGLVGDLFIDPGTALLSSELLWENYNLNWETGSRGSSTTTPSSTRS